MLILLRLAEDVITFQTLPQQRRRDIQHTLTQNMDSIFNFLLTILQQHVDEYRKLVGGGGCFLVGFDVFELKGSLAVTLCEIRCKKMAS